MRQVAGGGNGVKVTGDDHGWSRVHGLSDDRVSRSAHRQMSTPSERTFQSVSEFMFVVRLTGNVDQGNCDVDNVSRQIHGGDHVDTVAG